ncbi:MAG TPA: PAS domain S-box protein [Candidatus Angelobacter sp.]|nr:PAS domain S-box protein [Candidatus Angelobacter sp.]
MSDKQFVVSDARRLCRSLLDAVNDVVFIFDPGSSRVLAANKSACKVYGYTKKEMVGKHLQMLTTDATNYLHVLRSGRTFERTDVTKEGAKIEFLVSLSSIDYWGRRAILSINRDISDRKRIEAAISASEKRLQLLLHGISEIVALLDDKGIVRFVSPQVQRVLGVPTADVTGQLVFDFIHPDDRERAVAEFAKTVGEPGEGVPSVVRLKSQDGLWVPFEVIASNQLMDPAINGIIFTARDLLFRTEAEQAVRRANAGFDKQVEERTLDLAKANAALRIENQERRYAQVQLEHSLSLLNATLESTADGILVISNDGRVSTCNQKCLDIWHLPRIAVAGLRSGDLLSSVAPQLEVPEEFLQDLENLQTKPESVEFKTLKLKDGRILERYSQPQRVDGEIVGRVWSFRDITQASRLEEELRQSRKMEAVGRLAGGVAHDFNNILMIILGYANQLLADPDLPKDDRDYCERLIEASRRAATLTKQLLAFSRKHPIRPQVVNMNSVVTEITRMLQPLLSSHIQLTVNCRPGDLLIYVDSSQLESMIMNLVLNSRDAMPHGGILSLTTSSEVLPEDASFPNTPTKFVVLQISDTGMGMPPEIKERIFEPFFSTKDTGKGTGMGLAMVYGIVEQAEGHISVESEPNQGTTFRIYLPLSMNKAVETPVVTEGLPGRGDGKLLLVEDEAGIRLMTRKYLESLGYIVWEAENGSEALQIFRDRPGEIDLIVTDIIMPGMRGDDLVKEVRRERTDVAAIFISGYADIGDLSKEITILEKPFSFPELGRCVEEVLAKRNRGSIAVVVRKRPHEQTSTLQGSQRSSSRSRK